MALSCLRPTLSCIEAWHEIMLCIFETVEILEQPFSEPYHTAMLLIFEVRILRLPHLNPGSWQLGMVLLHEQ